MRVLLSLCLCSYVLCGSCIMSGAPHVSVVLSVSHSSVAAQIQTRHACCADPTPTRRTGARAATASSARTPHASADRPARSWRPGTARGVAATATSATDAQVSTTAFHASSRYSLCSNVVVLCCRPVPGPDDVRDGGRAVLRSGHGRRYRRRQATTAPHSP